MSTNSKQHGTTKSIFSAVWHNHVVKQVVIGSALTSLLMPIGAANAAPANFNALGSGIWDLVCGFIKSPIVAVVIGIAIISLFLVMAMNEDNGMLSKIIKVVIGAMCILFVPQLLVLMGFEVGNC